MRRSGPSGGLTAPQEASGEVIPLGDFTPAQTAHQLLDWLAAKSKISTDRLVILGVLAGAFIAVGGAFFTGVMDVSSLGHGPSRLLGGVVFSCGLLLVCASGAELSTGNCLLATAWATRRITIADVGRFLHSQRSRRSCLRHADRGQRPSSIRIWSHRRSDCRSKNESRLWTGVCARHSLQCPCVRRRLDDGISQDDHLKTSWPHFSDQRIYYPRV